MMLYAYLPDEQLLREQDRMDFVAEPPDRRNVWVKRAFFALCAAAALVDSAWMLLDVPYQLFAWLSIAMTPAFLLFYLLLQKRVTLEETKKQAGGRVMIQAALLASAAIPLLRAMTDFNILAWGRLILYAAVCLIPLVLITVLLSPECRAKKVLLITPALALAFWLIGSLAVSNVLLDPAPPSELPAVVLQLESHEDSDSALIHTLTAQTADGRVLEFPIAQKLYDTLAIGDGVTVLLCEGALHIPYADATDAQ